ncbi:MAG: 3-deoxy-7-phosphoheptulonate synthase [Alteromonadaceae bacterium]|uniref:3-deoxy-7-phosphoheptulonate synthase n=1 Tax=Marinobacter sp. BGYM27 TaxID=2975597 RepID=UPI000C61461D|nr:3-deoxy-7-phosphoheptulonate synthase [Marinobacter sp. BGYM27]MAA66680.1 3-deoxy-7-phosphoheptulonate synthase [Alteromonadaceae bacterium]MBH84844.1 3-deoxy-7-phosphoheptulonate synthase [Alteromonadaceae bacterium]MDG5501420.1 3-deoxy-7-phosphoheptulonate synthase [Marinobacter sp. BGYM27]|tara:strand:- start:784 stop:1881 length:1098 start_codon:yes stop_codon:yes gene_type:complete
MNMPMPTTDVKTTTALNPHATAGNDEERHTVVTLPTPAQLRHELPVSAELAEQVARHRNTIRRVLAGDDPRMLLVVGPCSVHDEVAALEYGERLARLAETVSDQCVVVMRAYLEKPRTTVGWKGLLYDPERTGQGDMAQGLVRSRRLLLNLASLGLPLATEALNPVAVNYLEDLVSWTAIGARTTESQLHREMASGLPMPVGFKNGTDGSVGMALNAMQSARHSHHLLGMDPDGRPAMLITGGNQDVHLVLRGGRGITNYDADSISEATEALAKADLSAAIMVDCSHDNACKQAERQMSIARDVVVQRCAGNTRIRAIMLESFLEPGRQNDGADLLYGQSITDPCLGWIETETLLQSLADLLRRR